MSTPLIQKDVETYSQPQNGNGSNPMRRSLHSTISDLPFPFLETIMVAAKRHPYAMLTAMISVAGLVIVAVTTLAVSIITGMLLMYGQMRENTAEVRSNTALMVTILKKQDSIEAAQTAQGNAIRAYEAANGNRLGIIVGLMSPSSQRAYTAYSQANPMPSAATKKEN